MFKLLFLSFLFVSCNVVQMVENGETQIDDTFFQTGDNGNFYCPGPMVCSPNISIPIPGNLRISWIEPSDMGNATNIDISYYHIKFYDPATGCVSQIGTSPSVIRFNNYIEQDFGTWGLDAGLSYNYKIVSCKDNVTGCDVMVSETSCLGPFTL